VSVKDGGGRCTLLWLLLLLLLLLLVDCLFLKRAKTDANLRRAAIYAQSSATLAG
jgi:hypothetical protein